jgi:lysophospholipase L1-like esterase/dienelactone hydrolase
VNQYPVPVDDCRRAVRWVRDHAAEYGVDATKLGAAGDSAGGHLVAMLGTSDGPRLVGEVAPPSSRVQAVVDIFGPADLTGDSSHKKIGQLNVQDLVDSFLPTPEAKREASPLFHIDDNSAAFLIFHGDQDPLVDVKQSRDFHAALKKAGRSSEYVEFPGAGHGFAGKDWETLVAKSIAFFDRELKGVESPPVAGGGDAPARSEPQVDLGALFRMHYTNRVKSFQEQNLVFQNVVLVGDSITEGFDVTKLLPGRRVLNRGIGADVIGNGLPEDDKRGVLARLDESIFDCGSVTDVFLMIGINDLGSGRTPDVMEQGYREILKRIKEEAPGVRVHVESLLPCRDRFAKHNAHVLDFNQRLQKLAEEFGYDYVDLHALMVDDKGELQAEFTGDGLHLNAAGYAPWKAEVERVMGW